MRHGPPHAAENRPPPASDGSRAPPSAGRPRHLGGAPRRPPLHGRPDPRRRPPPYLPPFPPRPSGDGEPFAETWWGRAWVTALEDGALDAARLARGRGYAEQGHVDAITVTPGLVLAYVQGSRPAPTAYRYACGRSTTPTGTVSSTPRPTDRVTSRPCWTRRCRSPWPTAASPAPRPRRPRPRCSCPDSGHPCKHAAALCYQTARLLDADPFVLLLLRGRGEREVIDALSRLSAARAARAAQGREPEPLPGVRATDAVSRRGPELPPLPAPLPPPQHPEQPPVYPASPAARTPSHWTSSPPTRRPARTPCSPRAATRSARSPSGTTRCAWPPPAPARA